MKPARTLFARLVPLIVMASLGAVALPVSADDRALPGGSWQQTCKDGHFSGDMLVAQCRMANGSYRVATARLSSCQAFGNRDGSLFCETPGTNARWGGSFSASCRDISVDRNGRLSATCRKDNGTYVRTNLIAKKCPSYRAGNSNGRLVCESQSGMNVGRWEGSFRSSCRDASTNSAGMLTATCQTANGNWQRTSLSVRDCTSYRAGNSNGHLVCESQSDYGRWEGSFRSSCRDASTDLGMLTATCQTANGNWQRKLSRDCTATAPVIATVTANRSHGRSLGRLVPQLVP